ncbi:MAG: preprotein translocase subunit SecE [Proteobacteria bacterium]|nr:preprotein translocase subunit SecE [Pseudomonadota bacterium]
MTQPDARRGGSRPEARTLGLLRWVQLAFMAAGAGLFWLLDKAITPIWRLFQEPNATVVSAVSLVAAAAVVGASYRNPRLNQLTHEVAGELSKVTWPSKQETSTSTVVVIITSLIAAAILGAFDAVWSAITDLIYKV